MNDIREEISRLPSVARQLIEELLDKIERHEEVQLGAIAREIVNLPPEQQTLVKSVLQKAMSANRGNGRPASLPPLVSLPRKEGINIFPLSYAQQRLWLLDQLAPGSPAYNQLHVLSMKGKIVPAKLQDAINEVVRRHESLRTTFSVVDGQPLQIVAPPQPLSFPLKDLRGIPEDRRQAEMLRLSLEEGRRSFDLKSGPLMRVLLLRVADQEHILVLTLHHIIFDGWSLLVMLREIAQLYAAFSQRRPSPLPALTIQYADFASWQRDWLKGDVLQSHLAYWSKQLGGELPVLELPSYKSRPAVQGVAGAAQQIHITPELTRALREYSRRKDVTLYMTLLAAFNVLLFRFTGQKDIVVGSPIAGQNRAELENLIGFFVNTLALRTDLSGEPSFNELLMRVREVCLGAYAHEDVPFEKIVEDLQPERNLERTPIFQTFFVLFNTRKQSLQFPDLTMDLLDVDIGTAKFDLSLYCYELGDEVSGYIEYNTDILDDATGRRMAEMFDLLLQGIVADPDERISRLPLLIEAERQQTLVTWNSTHHDYRRDICIHNLFEEQAQATPDAVAIIAGDEQLTFTEVNRRANQLAHFLQKLDVGPETRVGICLNRSAGMVIGLLGILKAGACYVPLDPSYPQDRLAFMIDDAQISLLLTEETVVPNITNTRARVLFLDSEWRAISGEDAENCSSGVSALNAAYVIYTSGSTGTPKGVVGVHQAAINRFSWMWDAYPFKPDEVCCQKTPLSFVDSIWEIFGPLLRGTPLLIIPDEVVKEPARLVDALAENEVTRIVMVPSLLRVILETQNDLSERLAKLKYWVCSGETLPLDLANQFHSNLRDALLINLYGSSEVSADVTFHEVSEDHSLAAVPIGKPIWNTQIYLLDQEMQPVPIGVSAELYVAGEGLARCYLMEPAQTAERFLPDPFHANGGRLYRTGDFARYLPDGSIQYLGRRDQQVKIRGKRVELAEVETALRDQTEVRECAVLARLNKEGEQQLVAYVVPETVSNAARVQSLAGELQNDQINQWRTVWDQTYRETPLDHDPTFNITGWNSSYTGLPISEPEMREWVDFTVADILSLRPKRVLEIGCGSGLLLFQIAPHCEAYVGTDVSEISLDQLRRAVSEYLPQLPADALLHKEANDFDGLKSFDGIILNSVVQYFPGIEYLVRVLEKAVNALDREGFIYVGDVRSMPLLETARTSIEFSRASSSLSLDKLRQHVQKAVNEEKELVIDPRFFFALKKHLPRISRVEVMPKRGRHRNELTGFRYQVVIHVTANEHETEEFDWRDWRKEPLSLADLRSRLIHEKPERVAFTDVANARLATEVQTVAALSQSDGAMMVGEFKEVFSGSDSSGIDPEDLWQLNSELPYSVQLSWARHDKEGRYDFVMRRHDSTQSESLAPFPEPEINHKSWNDYANDPVGDRYGSIFARELQETLKKKLPEYMIPGHFMILEKLPLTPSGKLDRRKLPQPESSRPELAERYVAPRTEVEELLTRIWSELLHVERVGIHDNFFKLGGHSLLVPRILVKVQELFSVTLPMRLVLQSPTVAGMAQAIDLIRSGAEIPSLAFANVIDLKAEAELDQDIYPVDAVPAGSVPEKILLTGATGFLGTFLLHDLLQQTNARVFCLVRGSDRRDIARKLEAALQDKLLWNESLRSRIEPVLGDLSEPLLGLSPVQFEELSKEIDLIYHNGAVVNFSYPYAELKAPNVLGTKEVLKLACRTKVKPVHFISTVGVLSPRDADANLLGEDVNPEHFEDLTSGYSQSKWVAERLVKTAGSRGLPICIYRPGLIAGDSRTGVSNLNDFACRYIKGCIQLGRIPEGEEDLDIVPVDFVSQAIVHLSLQKESAGKVFHLVNPQPLDGRRLDQWFTSLKYGLQKIPYSQWRSALEASPDNPLYTLLPIMPELQDQERMMIPGKVPGRVQIRYDSRNTLDMLRATRVSCPPVDTNLLNKYISYLDSSGFLSSASPRWS